MKSVGTDNLYRESQKQNERVFWGEECSNISRITLFTDPNGWFPQLVRSIRAISLLIMLMIVPFQFAFKNESEFHEETITFYLIIIDILYGIKLFFQSFLLPYVDRMGNTITHPREIFKKFIG